MDDLHPVLQSDLPSFEATSAHSSKGHFGTPRSMPSQSTCRESHPTIRSNHKPPVSTKLIRTLRWQHVFTLTLRWRDPQRTRRDGSIAQDPSSSEGPWVPHLDNNDGTI
ncbi:unnamed protein product [Durusdinium trenchii]|uniref:Uncharacterized protein n=1 Tax=Durusdinium trenchii TaxID=1381693 RepID=A0ABP0KBC9_9DINO